MATYTQAGRPLVVTTPLGPDALLLVGFRGREEISKPFEYELDLLAPARYAIAFERLMGQMVTVELRRPYGPSRFFHGLVRRFSQGHTDGELTSYRAELVPDLWLLTRRSGCRIFQHVSVPEILHQVFVGMDVSYQLTGTFHPRDYCAQYREPDFDFASRLMEEEGIFYFFRQTERSCQLVLANTPLGHPDIPDLRAAPFDPARAGREEAERITSWRKVQELRSGKFSLRDHCFELPETTLEATRPIQPDVPVGRVNHKLNVGMNGKLEQYDYPAGSAQRFDGIDRGGSEQPEELPKIFEDNQRTVGIRIQEEATPGLVIHGAGSCRTFLPGHKFMLTGHDHGDGSYVLTRVEHVARQGGFAASDRDTPFIYENTFDCIPFALPYRPARTIPRPVIHGTQTATVVGPAGEEIFVDKYGRIKVQFHWDREGRRDADSSCWVRVAQAWAGRQYGTFFWPRVGHEVVVAFEEGDPDRPIVIGSVYNAANVTPWPVPQDRDWSGTVTQSTPGGTPDEFNELSFKDLRGEECIYMHAQRDFRRYVKHDDLLVVDNRQEVEIKKGRKQVIVDGDDEEEVTNGHIKTHAKGDQEHTADGSYRAKGTTFASLTCKGSYLFLTPSLAAMTSRQVSIYGTGSVSVRTGGASIYLRGGTAVIRAAAIRLQAAKITLDAPSVEVTGFLKCPVLQADAVVAANYSPGAGNIL